MEDGGIFASLGILLSFIKMFFGSIIDFSIFSTELLSTPLSDTGRLCYLCTVFMYGYSVQLK